MKGLLREVPLYITLHGQYQIVELWYISDISQFAMVYQIYITVVLFGHYNALVLLIYTNRITNCINNQVRNAYFSLVGSIFRHKF